MPNVSALFPHGFEISADPANGALVCRSRGTGHVGAETALLGALAIEGRGCEKDADAARRHFQRAASRRSPTPISRSATSVFRVSALRPIARSRPTLYEARGVAGPYSGQGRAGDDPARPAQGRPPTAPRLARCSRGRRGGRTAGALSGRADAS